MEREPQPRLITVVVRTCRGEIETHVAGKAKDGEIALAQCQIANLHDSLVHQKTEPCKKSFYTRP